jgi:hypothetical protein
LGGPSPHIQGRAVFGEYISSMSCWSRSACTVAVVATDLHSLAALIQTEMHGTWGAPSEVPSSVTRPGTFFQLPLFARGTELTCTSRGVCLLGGYEAHRSAQDWSGAVEQESGGRWEPPVRGLGIAGRYVASQVTSVACHTSGICVAAGESYLAKGRSGAPFAQVEVKGRWMRPFIMKSFARRNEIVFVTGSACPTLSTCDLVGELTTGTTGWNPSFVATYSSSKWRDSAITIDGDQSEVGLTGLSCSSQSACWVSGTVGGDSSTQAGVVFPFQVPTGGSLLTPAQQTTSTTTTTTSPANRAVASCGEDAKTVGVAVAAFEAENPARWQHLTSSEWMAHLLGRSSATNVGGPFLQSWPTPNAADYSIAVAGERAQKTTGNKVAPSDGDVIVTIPSSGLTYDATTDPADACLGA